MPRKIDKLMLNARIFLAHGKMRKYTRLSLEAQQALTQKRLLEVLKCAYKTDFYHERFKKAGLTPADITSSDMLLLLPELTKEEYREFVNAEVNRLPSSMKKSLFFDGTSGSTGLPLSVPFMPDEYATRQAKWLRVLTENGHSLLSDKVFAIVSPHRKPKRDSILQSIGIARRTTVSQLDTAEHMVTKYNEQQPDLIYGNKSQLLQMIMYAKNNGITLHVPKHYISVAETMDSMSKALITEAFGKDGYIETYGCTEMGTLAYINKYSNGLFFIAEDTNIILPTDGTGTVTDNGYVLLTSLFQKTFPLINYKIGDSVESRVVNGRRYITGIMGRTDDWLVFEDGEHLPFHYFYEAMESVSFVCQFRVVQESYTDITLTLVKSKSCTMDTTECEKIIDSNIKRVFGERSLKITYNWQAALTPDPNGKIRMLISKVAK